MAKLKNLFCLRFAQLQEVDGHQTIHGQIQIGVIENLQKLVLRNRPQVRLLESPENGKDEVIHVLLLLPLVNEVKSPFYVPERQHVLLVDIEHLAFSVFIDSGQSCLMQVTSNR